MSVYLSPQVEAMIRQKVDSGDFADADEVVREALRVLEERERVVRLRAALAAAEAQIDRGEFVDWTPDLLDQLSQEADGMDRQGLNPHRDVLP